MSSYETDQNTARRRYNEQRAQCTANTATQNRMERLCHFDKNSQMKMACDADLRDLYVCMSTSFHRNDHVVFSLFEWNVFQIILPVFSDFAHYQRHQGEHGASNQPRQKPRPIQIVHILCESDEHNTDLK